MFWLKFHYFDFWFKDLNGHLWIGTFPYIKYQVFPPCLLCPKGIAYKATKVFIHVRALKAICIKQVIYFQFHHITKVVIIFKICHIGKLKIESIIFVA
jgi:hypothetical protein